MMRIPSSPKCALRGALLATALLGVASASAQAPQAPAPEAPAELPAAAPLLQASPRAQVSHSPGSEARPDLIELALEPSPGGLTADEVARRARDTSPQLISATMQRDKAAANKARAQLAFAPRLDVMAKYTRLSEVDLPTLGAPGMGFKFPQVLDQYYGQASVSLPITDLFLTILPTYRGASQMSTVVERQRQAAELEVTFNARIAFYQYVRARGFVVVSEDSVRLLEANVRDLEALVRAGAATETDLLRVKAQLANQRAALTQRMGDVEVSLVQLGQLLGAPVDPRRPMGEPLVGVEIEATPDAASVLAHAQAERPELLALRSMLEVRSHFAAAREGSQWPQLKAVGNVYYAQPNPRVFPQQEQFDTTWDVGLALSWSPNDYAFARTQSSDAELEVKLVREDLHAFEQRIALEAASAVSAHRTAREQVAAKVQGVEAARRRYDDQHALMMAGAVTPNEVLEAEDELRTAQLQWIDAFVQARMAQAALMKAQGQTGVSNSTQGLGSKP